MEDEEFKLIVECSTVKDVVGKLQQKISDSPDYHPPTPKIVFYGPAGGKPSLCVYISPESVYMLTMCLL